MERTIGTMRAAARMFGSVSAVDIENRCATPWVGSGAPLRMRYVAYRPTRSPLVMSGVTQPALALHIARVIAAMEPALELAEK